MRDRLLGWVACLDQEIAYLRKEGADQALTLTSGSREPNSAGPGGVYVFLSADPSRLPEDAGGTLFASDLELPAYVVAHEGNRLWLLLESVEELPAYFPTARFELSQTQLLERLQTSLEDLIASGDFGLAAKVFGEESAGVGSAPLPAAVTETLGTAEMRSALQQALGSEVTFLWGPPGTGKTFSIAALVATLVQGDETVLVTSHTHAAVEQALWALIEPPAALRPPGLLHDDPTVHSGRILKVGPLRQSKIPRRCHLDGQLEVRRQERAEKLGDIRARLGEVERQSERHRSQLEVWRQRTTVESSVASARDRLDRSSRASSDAAGAHQEALRSALEAESGLARSETSFIIGRRRRIGTSMHTLVAARKGVAASEVETLRAQHDVERDEALLALALAPLGSAVASTEGLSSEQWLNGQITENDHAAAELRSTDTGLEHEDDQLADELVGNALALFATLTKLYVDANMRRRQWDNVIIDEASMAMPPLVALAASRARKRIIICGDFYQLPPIVHSRDGQAREELGRDVFDIRGIRTAIEAGNDPEQLVRLSVQHRMHPSIADIARRLTYGDGLVDSPELINREPPAFCDVLTSDRREQKVSVGSAHRDRRVLVVDIAALGGWCGRVRGSLSRFNFYSAHVAVELALLYARDAPRLQSDEAPPIGIITPYAAQRRYIAKLVEKLGPAADSVVVGTVHTFQGNECDVVIFDTVLSDPYWSARLTDPHALREVRRDLNVAVTRARHEFVVVADATWFNKHARPDSGYGELWEHLQLHADTLDLRDVLGRDFRSKIAAESAHSLGWTSVEGLGAVTLLDETTFYPAFIRDLAAAEKSVVLYTPYIGKQRWPLIEPHITATASRGVEVTVVHKPLHDPAWSDTGFRDSLMQQLKARGVILVPVSGVHAKTIMIDDHIVYEGSLNWASQIESYEHMLRIEDRDLAALEQRMMQVPETIAAFSKGAKCPKCGGPLMLVNQRRRTRNYDTQPLKLGCIAHETSRTCEGYLRDVNRRAPFVTPPTCDRGEPMTLRYSKTGKPWHWTCSHRACASHRWRSGDIES